MKNSDERAEVVLSKAPCDKCGYNGPGYYQPETHSCAATLHSVNKLSAKLYTYKLPDDYEIYPKHRAALDVLVQKTGISNEDAQAFLDLHVEITEDLMRHLSN